MPIDTGIPNDVWLAAYLASTPDHVYFKDREFRFVWVSDSLARSLGRVPEEIIGRTDADFFGADRARSYRIAECEIINTGKPVVDHIVEHSWPDGHVTWSLNVAMPVQDASGHIVGIWGTNKDITILWVAIVTARGPTARLPCMRFQPLYEASSRRGSGGGWPLLVTQALHAGARWPQSVSWAH